MTLSRGMVMCLASLIAVDDASAGWSSFLDIDERIFELAISQGPQCLMSVIGDRSNSAIFALIEGGVCNAENVQVLREMRANAKILVAIGACAITGGLPAMRNRLDIGDVLNEVYCDLDGAQSHVPNDPELPLLFDKPGRLGGRFRSGHSTTL